MCLRLPLYSLNLHHDLIRQLIYTFGNALINYGLARRLIIFIIVYFAIPSPLNTRNLFSASLDCVTSLHSPLPRLLLLLSVVHLSKFIEHARDELYLILNRLNLDSFLTWHIEVSFVLNDLQVSYLQVLLEFIQLVVIFLQKREELPVVILCEIKILVPLCQSILEL